jgi:predicted enzyme related to lactoylglutathione lyase
MATSHLRDICFDCIDPDRVAHFWAAVLGYTLAPPSPEEPDDPSIAIHAPAGGLRIWFNKVPEPKVVKNRVHIDINMPDGAELERLQRLGARILGEIREAEERVRWTIMADPEGNEFCAFPPQS